MSGGPPGWLVRGWRTGDHCCRPCAQRHALARGSARRPGCPAVPGAVGSGHRRQRLDRSQRRLRPGLVRRSRELPSDRGVDCQRGAGGPQRRGARRDGRAAGVLRRRRRGPARLAGQLCQGARRGRHGGRRLRLLVSQRAPDLSRPTRLHAAARLPPRWPGRQPGRPSASLRGGGRLRRRAVGRRGRRPVLAAAVGGLPLRDRLRRSGGQARASRVHAGVPASGSPTGGAGRRSTAGTGEQARGATCGERPSRGCGSPPPPRAWSGRAATASTGLGPRACDWGACPDHCARESSFPDFPFDGG